jgi:NADH-quinone oxidoreductase subunit G
MVEMVRSLGDVDAVAPGDMGAFGIAGEVDAAPFESPVTDYYLANAICRASPVMAECSRLYLGGKEATGTDG